MAKRNQQEEPPIEAAPATEKVPTTETDPTTMEPTTIAPPPTTTTLVDSVPTTTTIISATTAVEMVIREKGQMSEVTPRYILLKPDMPLVVHEIAGILKFGTSYEIVD